MTPEIVSPPEVILVSKDVITWICVVFSGLILKIIYDWFSTGRIKPGVFMTINECKQNRSEGCPAFTTHKALTDQKFTDFQKQLEQSSSEFKATAKDISEIKTSIAVIASVVENLSKNQDLITH